MEGTNVKHQPLQNFTTSTQAIPVTSLRWRPHITGSKTKNILVASNADGGLTYWHVTSGKMLHKITEENN